MTSFDDLIVGQLHASPQPVPTIEEIRATLERIAAHRPSYTAFVQPADVERVGRAVGDAWLGLDVEVVASPFVPDGHLCLINHEAIRQTMAEYGLPWPNVDATDDGGPQ